MPNSIEGQAIKFDVSRTHGVQNRQAARLRHQSSRQSGANMRVARVTVNDETFVVRAGEEQQAIHALAGDDAADADVRIEHADMSPAE